MHLLSVSRENGCLVIHTDKGDRKVMLTWRGIAGIEEKCKKFIGKKIRHTTYGSYDPEIWFSDIFLDEQEKSSSSMDNLNQIPTNYQTIK
jgi:hypothetical protein